MGRAPLLRCHKKPSTAIYEAGRAFLLLPSVQRPRPLQRLSVIGSPGVNEMQSTVDIPRALYRDFQRISVMAGSHSSGRNGASVGQGLSCLLFLSPGLPGGLRITLLTPQLIALSESWPGNFQEAGRSSPASIQLWRRRASGTITSGC
ncbi:unnamed protein product [Gadus morhua 'NCC']